MRVSALRSITAPQKVRKWADDAIAYVGPQRGRHVNTAAGGALLTLELEAAARDRNRESLGLGRRVGEDEVLSAGLADQTRIRPVVAGVGTDLVPHLVEHRRAASEMDARKLRRRQRRRRDHGGVSGHEVDDSRGEAGRFEQPHQVVAAEDRG
jgi:hypothetical protein